MQSKPQTVIKQEPSVKHHKQTTQQNSKQNKQNYQPQQ